MQPDQTPPRPAGLNALLAHVADRLPEEHPAPTDPQPLRTLRYRLEDYSRRPAYKRCACGDSKALHDIATRLLAEAERRKDEDGEDAATMAALAKERERALPIPREGAEDDAASLALGREPVCGREGATGRPCPIHAPRQQDPWQQAADGLNALADAGVPFYIDPDGHITNVTGEIHIEWDDAAQRWFPARAPQEGECDA
jgi:hypothetical protein